MKRYQDSILLINKEAGLTSHDEVNRVRKILDTKKVGHSGTLDPKVTGMLVMGIGKGTKVLEYMLMAQKVYIAEFIFHKKISRSDLEQALDKFTGSIKQTPPRRSSVKREEREREIYSLRLVDFSESGRSASIVCSVERGTYIRKLVHDIGEYLGVGAHMGRLHRTQVGPFSEKKHSMITVKKLKRKFKLAGLIPFYDFGINKYFYSIEQALENFPKIIVDRGAVQPMKNGSPLFTPGIIQYVGSFLAGSIVLLLDDKHKVFGIAEALYSSEQLRDMSSGQATKTIKIL